MKSHHYYVTKFAIELMHFAENPIELVWASMLHDIGIPYCSGRKIVESEIEFAPEDKKEELKALSDNYRLQHMQKGARIARFILNDMRASKESIELVIDLIAEHDMYKINPNHVYTHDGCLLFEADLLWMWTEDGIARDIARAKENGLPHMSIKDQFLYNTALYYHKLNYGIPIYHRLKREILPQF